jgi:rhodanese-related sulfurtransferase
VNFIINNIFLIGIALACIILLLLPILQGRGPNLSAYQVTQKMNQTRVIIVDLRKEEEYAASHIKNAIHIPAEELMQKLGRIERYKNEPIVVVCATGPRSARATSQLKKVGFKDVSSMEGGMKVWLSDNMPVESSETAADAEKGKGKKKGKA